MVDLNVEIQFSLSSNVKIGLGAGYLSGSDEKHMGGNFGFKWVPARAFLVSCPKLIMLVNKNIEIFA